MFWLGLAIGIPLGAGGVILCIAWQIGRELARYGD